jgi:Domain of unknown function (DUF4331)
MTPLFRLARPMASAALLGLMFSACNDDTGPAGDPGTPEFSALLNRATAQVDRFGLPAIATVFIPTSSKDAYNTAAPSGDRATFQHFVIEKLTAFGTPNPQPLADFVQPDIQPVDLTKPTVFPNGRRLQDDVITAELGLIFGANAALNDDHVDANDKSFLTTFPYLAAPHTE